MFKVSASLEHACLQSLTKVLDSTCHRFLKVIPDHLQFCATLVDCGWLTVLFILSTRLQNCNADYLRYQFNSETCRIDAIPYRCHGFIFQQDGAPAHRACNARLVKRHCSDFIAKHKWPPNSQDLNLLDCHVWGAMLIAYHKLDITSWTNRTSTTEELQTTHADVTSEILHAGSSPGSSYIFQVSRKSV